MTDQDKLKRIETFLYILLIIQFLSLIAMFLVLQQVNKSVIEIKRFCWADQVVDNIPINPANNPNLPYINIIH